MEQMDFLRQAVDALENLGVPYMVVGSYASSAYGEARFTQDIDIVAALEERHVPGFLAAFPEPDCYLSAAAVREAIRTGFQFNVIHPASGNKIDFILPRADAWGQAQLARARPTRLLPDCEVMTAAPEDVILGKMWYYSMGGSDKHLRDIAGMLRVAGAGVDRADVEKWARQLGYFDIWQQIVAIADGPDRPPGPGVP